VRKRAEIPILRMLELSREAPTHKSAINK